jgi:hypothetical protein
MRYQQFMLRDYIADPLTTNQKAGSINPLRNFEPTARSTRFEVYGSSQLSNLVHAGTSVLCLAFEQFKDLPLNEAALLQLQRNSESFRFENFVEPWQLAFRPAIRACNLDCHSFLKS